MSKNFAAVADGMAPDQMIRLTGTLQSVGRNHDDQHEVYHLDEGSESYIYLSARALLDPEYPVTWFDQQ
jgi:hypothetical protein